MRRAARSTRCFVYSLSILIVAAPSLPVWRRRRRTGTNSAPIFGAIDWICCSVAPGSALQTRNRWRPAWRSHTLKHGGCSSDRDVGESSSSHLGSVQHYITKQFHPAFRSCCVWQSHAYKKHFFFFHQKLSFCLKFLVVPFSETAVSLKVFFLTLFHHMLLWFYGATQITQRNHAIIAHQI